MKAGQYYSILIMISGSTWLILEKIDNIKEDKKQISTTQLKDSIHFNCVYCNYRNVRWVYDSAWFKTKKNDLKQ